jgi:cystathionine beta-synthase
VAAQQVLDLIGNTPLVEVTSMDAGKCRLFLKMESQNPDGSISGFATRGRNSVRPVAGRLS